MSLSSLNVTLLPEVIIMFSVQMCIVSVVGLIYVFFIVRFVFMGL